MTKHYTITFLFLLLFYTASAQDKKWSVEASYPVFLNSEDLSPDRGIIDLGVKYVLKQSGSTQFGIGVNSMLFSENEQGEVGSFGIQSFDLDSRLIVFQPKFLIEFDFPSISGFSFNSGLGYSFLFNNTEGTLLDENGDPFGLDISETDSGLNASIGLSYDISSRWYVLTQIDYIYNFNDNVFPSHIYLLKAGIGFQF